MSSRLAARLLGPLLAVSLAGCHVQTSNLGGDDALNTQAATAYTQLVQHQDDALLDQMSSQVNKAEAQAQLPMLQGLVPAGPPPSPQEMGTENYTGTDGRIYSVAQDYAYPDRTVHAATRLIHEGEAWKILSFNVNVTMKAQQAPTAESAVEPVTVDRTT